jgi:hypothetical protein
VRIRSYVLAALVLFISPFALFPACAQETPASSRDSDDKTVEGTVVSASRQTLVLRLDDNQFQLFTYDRPSVRPLALNQGARVRIVAGAADDNGARSASSVEIINDRPASSQSPDKGAPAAPVPQKVEDLESDIKREARHWHLGVFAGAAFDPELFHFGVQSQFGPILHPRFQLRPSAEFAFGEVTDLIAVNLNVIYRFSPASRIRNWTPYVGTGPAFIFIHQSFQSGRDISFGNFDYETGFNMLVGSQSRKGTFVELRTSLYSGPAPKLRVTIGRTF